MADDAAASADERQKKRLLGRSATQRINTQSAIMDAKPMHSCINKLLVDFDGN
jgi:hypothetical protein